MSKKFEQPMINVYNFKYHDIATEGLSGYEGNDNIVEYTNTYNGNYITVKGTFDENVPL